jgi:5-methylcytosine-specific restriction protein B
MNKKVIPLLMEYFLNDENEVKNILSHAGLYIKEDIWPLKVTD